MEEQNEGRLEYGWHFWTLLDTSEIVLENLCQYSLWTEVKIQVSTS